MQQKLQEKLGSMAPEKQQLYSNMLGVPVSQKAQEQILDKLRTLLSTIQQEAFSASDLAQFIMM